MPRKVEEVEEEIEQSPNIEVVGNYPSLVRKRTGLFSFDYAVSNKGDLGLAMRTIVELSGHNHVGKSTLAYYLLGATAKQDDTPDNNISICDMELLDRDYIASAIGRSGYSGKVTLVDTTDNKGKVIPHETMMMKMVMDLSESNTGSAMMDSVSAIQPIAEAAGDFGEAFMGKRAKLVAQVARGLAGVLRNKERPSTAIVINHSYQIIGGRGHTTAGGIVLPALAGVRVHMWSGEKFFEDEDTAMENPIGFLVKGAIEKNRFGGPGRNFQFYIVPGIGVHVGVSAMFDCFAFGLAERGSRVKLGERSVGFLKADLLSYAADGRMRKFYPFMEAMDEYSKHVERGDVIPES
jgi:RecA/RadA recombinase